MEESRRGARVATTFLVAIEGIDREPTARKGDISATGAYFETSRNVGGVGTIHWLYLVSADRAESLRVMAYVVRTVRMDAGKRRIGGVAFEFMPENDDAAAAVHKFVRYVLALRRGEEAAHIEPRLDARLGYDTSPDAPNATVRQLSVRSMVLETSWPIEPGEMVRVDIVAPGMTRRIRLDGRAVRVAPKEEAPSTWDIEVEVQQETARPIRTHSSMSMPAVKPEDFVRDLTRDTHPDPAPTARDTKPDDEEVARTLDDLLSALILPPEREPTRERAHHLSGQIARIRLPTLLALFEMERMTGRLVATHGEDEARIFFKDGAVVDVEPTAPGSTPRARMAEVLAWESGAFEFSVEPVVRNNRIGVGTTALLLDLARESDERSRR